VNPCNLSVDQSIINQSSAQHRAFELDDSRDGLNGCCYYCLYIIAILVFDDAFIQQGAICGERYGEFPGHWFEITPLISFKVGQDSHLAEWPSDVKRRDEFWATRRRRDDAAKDEKDGDDETSLVMVVNTK